MVAAALLISNFHISRRLPLPFKSRILGLMRWLKL
jgi:hypothetical protein